ncbi:hypothetical protein PCASD_03191 [Puccinia coronata f. sp. avenae]|uniref:Uncharacterized protein n=1 Tax=Puccinia coronata f. sp. avenae TaxID=200324 RepID=A0A2N5VFI5_9BASI|nr:hypothetical protein PCASD_03191 [Puccinia coronata f. sp. avenae]
MGSLKTIAHHRFLSCLCLGLAFLATALANFAGHLCDSATHQYVTRAYPFAVLSPDHHSRVAPSDGMMREGEEYQLFHGHQPSEPTRSMSREDLPYGNNLASSIRAELSYHPYPPHAQVGRSDSTLANPSLVPPNQLTDQTLPNPSESQEAASGYSYGNVRMDPLSTNLRTVLQQYDFKPFFRNYFTASGDFAIPPLKRRQDAFKVELDIMKYYTQNTDKTIPSTVDLKSPMLIILKKGILKGLAPDAIIATLTSHYRNLILFMHKIYEETMDNQGMPLVAQTQHQEEMLKWLYLELFHTTLSPERKDFSDHLTGPIQVKLMKYFSQSKYPEFLPTTALWLLEEFQKKYSMNKNAFGETHFFQTKLTDKTQVGIKNLFEYVPELVQKIRRSGIKTLVWQAERMDWLVDSVMEVFKEQMVEYSEKPLQVKHIHPTLPIGMFESEFMASIHHSHQIRILKPQAPSPLEKIEVTRVMQSLLRQVDLFHCYLLNGLKTLGKDISNSRDRRRSMLMWLIESYLKPADGLPIHGLAPITKNHAYYDHLFQQNSLNLFGPVQRTLITYLTKCQHDST